MRTFGVNRMKAEWTGGQAEPATYTFQAEKLDFRLPAPRFRVVTPETPEIAPLEKYVRTDARSVMQGHALNIKNAGSLFAAVNHYDVSWRRRKSPETFEKAFQAVPRR
jgi:hypothetical protein